MRSVAPVLIALMVLGLVMGVGYWATTGPSAAGKAAAGNPQAAGSGAQGAGSGAVATNPGPGSGQPPTSDPPPQPPADTVPPPPTSPAAKAIVDKRTHIDRSNGAKDTMTIKLYYVDAMKDGGTLQPVEVLVPKSATTARAVVDNWLNAPGDLRLVSNVPVGTKVNSVDLKDGVATVDLSGEVAGVQGSASVQALQATLVYSLTSVPGVSKVQLKVNGKPAVMDQIAWTQPLAKADMDARNAFTLAPLIKYVP